MRVHVPAGPKQQSHKKWLEQIVFGIDALLRWRTRGYTVFFFEGGAINLIEKSAIITGEYWLRVYRSRPNFAQ